MRKSAPTAKLFCRHHWTNSTCHSSLTTHNTLPVREILGCRGQGIEDECARFKCEIVAGELRRKMRRGSAPASLADKKDHQRSEALRLHLLDTDGVPHSQESCTPNEGEIATPPAPERTPWQATRALGLQSQRLRSVEVTRNRSPPSWMAAGAFHSKSGESQEAVPDEGPDTRLAQTEWRATARNSEGGHPAMCQFPRIVKAGPTGHPDASGTHAWLKKTRKLNDKQQKR